MIEHNQDEEEWLSIDEIINKIVFVTNVEYYESKQFKNDDGTPKHYAVMTIWNSENKTRQKIKSGSATVLRALEENKDNMPFRCIPKREKSNNGRFFYSLNRA